MGKLLHPTPAAGEGWGTEPAGWIYVAWHPANPRLSKIGYTLWHPYEACERYPNGKKRLHDVEKYLVGFGFGKLEKWASRFHSRAQLVEGEIKKELRQLRPENCGRNREIFIISHFDLERMVEERLNAQTH